MIPEQLRDHIRITHGEFFYAALEKGDERMNHPQIVYDLLHRYAQWLELNDLHPEYNLRKTRSELFLTDEQMHTMVEWVRIFAPNSIKKLRPLYIDQGSDSPHLHEESARWKAMLKKYYPEAHNLLFPKD